MEDGKALVLTELWCSGASADEIGRRLGVSTTRVYRLAREHKLPKSCRPNKARQPRFDPTPDEIAERAAYCIAMREAGTPIGK